MKPEALGEKLKGQAFVTTKERLMQRIVLVVLARSQKRTPVRTGTLRRSETTRVEDGGTRGFLGSNVKYAPFVHDRVPFFAQGIEDARPEIEKLMKSAGDQFFAEIST